MNRVGPFQPSEPQFTTLIRQAFCGPSLTVGATAGGDREIAGGAPAPASRVSDRYCLKLE
jgi:hypothetical protein